jgi:nitrogen fixation protein NifU and related proteins
MELKNSYFTQSDLQFHAKNPLNFGLKSNLDFVSERLNPSCGDSITIGGFVKHDKLESICFIGSGCVISIAMASKLTKKAENMTFDQIRELDEAFVTELLGISLGINRMQCGMLSVLALQSGIEKFEKK